MDADLVLFSAADHAITNVISSGKCLLGGGALQTPEKFLPKTNRTIELHGKS
jgi:hypothetical protein